MTSGATEVRMENMGLSSLPRLSLRATSPGLSWALMVLGLLGCAGALGIIPAQNLPLGLGGPGFVALAAAMLLPSSWSIARPLRSFLACGVLAGVAWAVATAAKDPGFFLMGIAQSSGATAQIRPSAVLAFALMAVSILAVEFGHSQTIKNTAMACAGLVAGSGVIGLGMDVFNVGYFSLLPQTIQMGTASCICFSLAGLAQAGRAARRREPGAEVEASDVLRALDWLLASAVTVVAVVSFSLAQGGSEQQMLNQLTQSAGERRAVFESQIKSAQDLARQASERPAMGGYIKGLQNKRAEGTELTLTDLAPVQVSARKALTLGFTHFAFQGLDGWKYGEAGEPLENILMSADIKGASNSKILWREAVGYVFQSVEIIEDASGAPAAKILTERPLPELTRAHKDAVGRGLTGDMMVCSAKANSIGCFPFRWNDRGGIYPLKRNGRELLAARATRGEVSSETSLDYRGERVMVALGPIASSGLGMAVKMDVWEIYAPIRHRFYLALPFFALLGLGAMVLSRLSLHPLVERLERSREALRYAATHDELTGLPNRSVFVDRLEHALARSQRSGSLLGALYVDLDGFKQVNDVYGHGAGDKMLIWFSQALKESVRATDTVARLSGDEFAVILEDVGNVKAARAVGENILARLEAGSPPPDGLPRAKASIGGAFARGGQGAPAELLRRADMLLYEAKRAGRGRAEFESEPDADPRD